MAVAVLPDAGTIEMGGRPVALANPHDARDAGIETVYQDLALADRRSKGHASVERLKDMRDRWPGKLIVNVLKAEQTTIETALKNGPPPAR
jgi:ABC-type sugar transport system ATPase subunit